MKNRVLLWTFYVILIFGIIYVPKLSYPFIEPLLIGLLLVFIHIAYERQSKYKALKEDFTEKKRILDEIFRYIPDQIFCKDKNLRYLSGNKAFIDMHGGNESKVIGKDDSEVMPSDFEKIRKSDIEVLTTGTSQSYEQNLEIGTTERRIYHIVKAPMYDGNGEVSGLLAIARDITQEKEIEQQKDNFVETLTHDLKAPTTAQIKALELILNDGFGELKPEQREILTYTLNSCKYMLNMIMNILSTYKYDKGVKTLTLISFDFNKLVEESINELKYLSEDKHLDLIIEVQQSLPQMNADLIEIKRVVINLISNAIFYAMNHTEVKISVKTDENYFVFKVSTESNPLSREEVANLFKKFFTGVAKFRPVGTGLGLYLSKQIITAHGGSMIYESDDLDGNTFGFKLPID